MLKNTPVLLVEDDAVDVLLVHRVFQTLNIRNTILEASNGEEALNMLRESDTPRPGLILLDLNMPRMNGFEFLSTIKADPELRSIPVVILTTSNEKRDVQECFECQCAGYLVKPVDSSAFSDTIRAFQLYWTHSEVPTNTYE
ncbi:MAG: response regulator [Anaerolineales bacterium]|nr:response regulator [Anaerolineales bacterium]